MISAIDRWLDQQLQDYQSEKDDVLIKRFTSAWRSEGDQAVLLYLAVQHLAAIRATLERAESTKTKRGAPAHSTGTIVSLTGDRPA